jgi:hypothetical protein
MARRQALTPRRRAARPSGADPDRGTLPGPPVRDAEWWWRLALVVARNGVAVVGAVALGWSAPALLLLYFADTVARMGAVFTAAMFRLTGADAAEGFGDTLHGFLGALALGAFLAAVVAVPLAMPLVLVLGSSGAWRAALADASLRPGLLVVGLAALVATGRHWWAMTRGQAGEARVRRDFAIVFTRWVLVLVATYTGLGLLGGYAPYVLVAVYAAGSAWSELDPDRFANLVPDGRPHPRDWTGR